jgi:hypothetical protein
VFSNRDRFDSLKGTTRKKSFLDRLLYGSAVLIILGLIIFKSTGHLSIGGVISSALSKSNQGVILNFFDMSNDRIIGILGDPQNMVSDEKGDQIWYWNFDPLTLEIQLQRGNVSTITYSTSKEIIRDHIEERALRVYGTEADWVQRNCTIEGTPEFAYENRQSKKTVVKNELSVRVYNKLFP